MKPTAPVIVMVFWLFFVDKAHADGQVFGRRSHSNSGDLRKVSLTRGQRQSSNSGVLRTTRTRNRRLKEDKDEDCVAIVSGGALKKTKLCNYIPTFTPAISPSTNWRPAPAPVVNSGVVETFLPTTTRVSTPDFVSATPTMPPMALVTTTTSPSYPGSSWSPPTAQPAPSAEQQQQSPTSAPVTVQVEPPVIQPSIASSAPQPAIPKSPTSRQPPSLSQPQTPTSVPTTNNNNDAFGLINKTTITNEETGVIDTRMTCREPIPAEVALDSTTDQLITYAYILNVLPGTVVTLILPDIERVIQNEMAKDFLNCSFAERQDASSSFHVHQLSTAPADQPVAGCFDEERLFDAECYHITGFMRAVIFYMPTTAATTATAAAIASDNVNSSEPQLGQGPEHRHRQNRFLASQIEDPNVLEAFEVWFEQFFASDEFLTQVNNPQVASLNFAGITNEYQPPPPAESQTRTLVVVGAVMAGCLGVIVAALLVNYAIKKKQERAQSRFYQEAMDYVDEELDKEDDDKDDGQSTTMTRNNVLRNVVVVGEDETVLSGFPVLVDDGLRDPDDMRLEQNNYSLAKNNSSRDVNNLDHGVHFVPSVDPASMLEATKKDLGPRYSDQVNSPRRYNVRNTVEL